MAFWREIDDPSLICGTSKIGSHAGETRACEEGGRAEEGDRTASGVPVMIEYFPCTPAPEVDVEVSEDIFVAAVAWRAECVQGGLCARAAFTSLDPLTRALAGFVVRGISDHDHHWLIALHPIGGFSRGRN